MRKLTVTLWLTLAVLLGVTGVSASADFQKGVAAYKGGDYATALREWKPLAKQGNAGAQLGLSARYAFGYGVPKDYIYTYMWWNIAASLGKERAIKSTKLVAGGMLPSGDVVWLFCREG